jgi:hypothetical protein
VPLGPQHPTVLAGLALLLTATGWGPGADANLEASRTTAQVPPAGSASGESGTDVAHETIDPFAEPPPRDPDDTPFLPAPHNQLGHWSTGRVRPLTRGFDDDHRVMLGVVPTYAALHVPFIGRGAGPFRGGGIALELDVRVVRWAFIRVFASHTFHPAFEENEFDEDAGAVTRLANPGILHVTNTGTSLVWALDIGRFVPRVDVGAGLMFVRSPEAAQAGQWGGECRQGRVCDLGLSCSTDDVCRPAPTFEVHAGVGLDILFGRRWAVGLAVRYYAPLQALANLPFYVHGSLRLAARF